MLFWVLCVGVSGVSLACDPVVAALSVVTPTRRDVDRWRCHKSMKIGRVAISGGRARRREARQRDVQKGNSAGPG